MRALKHVGWQERKGGETVKMDITEDRSILLGEMEVKGDPTTIPVPEGGDLDELPQGSKKAKAFTQPKLKYLAIVFPTTIEVDSQSLRSNSSQWSSPKKVKRTTTARAKKPLTKQEKNPDIGIEKSQSAGKFNTNDLKKVVAIPDISSSSLPPKTDIKGISHQNNRETTIIPYTKTENPMSIISLLDQPDIPITPPQNTKT
ncbi:hypothetical protein C7212DRAFT_363020 [Tuber magnatum]|uniref:Uncharacterized protein n=1 Tax=Tuber magnatum TaxID=42249 RepID=A0A317SU84_9PEZI|nr:hypothetical protein C7212DRAFT_363020 [Tuber magnatum]